MWEWILSSKDNPSPEFTYFTLARLPWKLATFVQDSPSNHCQSCHQFLQLWPTFLFHFWAKNPQWGGHNTTLLKILLWFSLPIGAYQDSSQSGTNTTPASSLSTVVPLNLQLWAMSHLSWLCHALYSFCHLPILKYGLWIVAPKDISTWNLRIQPSLEKGSLEVIKIRILRSS